jgi:ribosomal protein S18
MTGIRISQSAILTLGNKLTVFVAENKSCPFKLTKQVDIILITEKDYEKNKELLAHMISDTTKIIYY